MTLRNTSTETQGARFALRTLRISDGHGRRGYPRYEGTLFIYGHMHRVYADSPDEVLELSRELVEARMTVYRFAHAWVSAARLCDPLFSQGEPDDIYSWMPKRVSDEELEALDSDMVRLAAHVALFADQKAAQRLFKYLDSKGIDSRVDCMRGGYQTILKTLSENHSTEFKALASLGPQK